MGYVKIDRKLLDNPLWADRPFSEGQAWIDLILIADYETKKKKWKGKDVWFKRGTVNTSMQSLGERWGWERGTVRRFMDKLVAENMVSVQTFNRQRTIITIIKYDQYQDSIKRKVAQQTEMPSQSSSTEEKINWNDVPD